MIFFASSLSAIDTPFDFLRTRGIGDFITDWFIPVQSSKWLDA